MAAKKDLIKGIDNTCDAARALARRAEENGFVWPKARLIKGVDNNCEAVRASVARTERTDGTPSTVQVRHSDDAFEAALDRPATLVEKAVGPCQPATLRSEAYRPSMLSRASR